MLKLENVSKFYYNKGIVATGFTKVNLELKMGEFVVITGESGSGKSTLLNVISGLDSYEEGEMYVNGQETSHYTEKDFEDYRRKYVANIFQSFNLVNSYTVYQNVELVLLLNGYKKKDIKAKVLDMIDQVGLAEFKNTKVSKLSGGQKQRVAIARAMIKETPIIVADEPTGNLDTTSAKEVIQILKRVAKDRLVVVVTHNIEQVEEVATRMVKMHDGKIVENRVMKEVIEEPKVEESRYHKFCLTNQFRLGFRNTFNLISKFCLLFVVFFFLSSAVLAEYSSFQMSEEKNKSEGFHWLFKDVSEKRVILNKKDRSPFTQEEFAKLESLENVDYVVEDDVLTDSYVTARKGDMGFSASIGTAEHFSGELDYGRMPENENEAVLQIEEDNFFVTDRLEDLTLEPFSLSFGGKELGEIIFVGIKTYPLKISSNNVIYFSKERIREIRKSSNQQYSQVRIFLNGQYERYSIAPSDKVKPGTVTVDDSLKYQFKNMKIKNQPCMIFLENVYYKEELNLTIGNTFTKDNYKKAVGAEKYELCSGRVFLNTDDYNSLYDKPSYQAGIYVKDPEKMDETLQELENMGIHAKRASDFAIQTNNIQEIIIRILKVVVTIILLIVLFFISYLIVYIILKSRQIYYTTLRMLGATYKNVRRILAIELFTNASISYAVLMAFLRPTQAGVIPLSVIANLVEYLSIIEYLGMYLILVAISYLISRRFSRKLFKKTAIATYSEEV